LRLLAVAAVAVAASPAAAEGVGAWEGPIAEASARFGVPVSWIRRVMQVESAGQTSSDGRPIRSRVGAMGLMQLMPGTWQAMRRAHGLGPDPDDPRDNILAGTAYLRAMYDRFGYPGLFAAYNAGPARYADYLARCRRLPAETVDYVARIASFEGRAPTVPVVAATGPSADVILVGPGNKPSSERTGVFFTLSGSAPH
jgi:soluble lytic murein transglycosylase-like protein